MGMTATESAGWRLINRSIGTDRATGRPSEGAELIDRIADEIFEKIVANGYKEYPLLSADCTELMRTLADSIARNIFQDFEQQLSPVEIKVQNFLAHALSDRNSFRNHFIKYCAARIKTTEGKPLRFSRYYLGSYFNNPPMLKKAFRSEEDGSVIKERSGETLSVRRKLLIFAQEKLGRYEVQELTNADMDVLLEYARTFPNLKKYTKYELMSFIAGRYVGSMYQEDADGKEKMLDAPAPVEYNADYFEDDLGGIVQKIGSFVADSKVRFTEMERDRAFVSILCAFDGEHSVLIRQADWLSKEQQDSLIDFIDECLTSGGRLSVKSVGTYLGIYNYDKSFNAAKEKVRRLLADEL